MPTMHISNVASAEKSQLKIFQDKNEIQKRNQIRKANQNTARRYHGITKRPKIHERNSEIHQRHNKLKMVRVNKLGYIEHRIAGVAGKGGRKGKRQIWREWFFVRHPYSNGTRGEINRTGFNISLPPQYVGKKVRFKIEVIKDK